MAGSEYAQIKQRIADEYQAAQWGLSGLAYGTTRHDFITKRTETIGETFVQLTQVVGSPETAMVILNETLEALPGTPTRFHLLDLLPRVLGNSEETAQLIDHIQGMWETIDLLNVRFGPEGAQKIIQTPSSCSSQTQENCQ
ncbi:MAG: hypothetical protein JOZ18_02155 [Chloroflexi bacterium]|nr:hypothetical protein [Chloroflexota bacterium]